MLMNMFIAMAVIAVVVIGLALAVSRYRRDGNKKTAKGEKRSGEEKRDWHNTLAIPATILLMLAVWYLVSPEGFGKVVQNKVFLGGLALITLATFLLAIPGKKFAERADRKLLLTIAVIAGLALMASKALSPVFDWSTTTASRWNPNMREFTLHPTTWTDCYLPPGYNIKRLGAPGDLELAFAKPVPDTLRIADGSRVFLNLSSPRNSFKARGVAGTLFFELE